MSLVGVVIPVRDRVAPLRNALNCLRAQTVLPQWVILSDLGSTSENAAELRGIAQTFQSSYLRLHWPGRWNKSVAVNTAIRAVPIVDHILQLDVDVMLRPDALSMLLQALDRYDAVVSVPYDVKVHRAFAPSISAFRDLVRQGERMSEWSVGGCVAYPHEWMLAVRGLDEVFEGWGNQDMEIWDRAQRQLRTLRFPEPISIHQSHRPQPAFHDEELKQRNLERRVRHWKEGAGETNPDGFGEAEILTYEARVFGKNTQPTVVARRRRRRR